MRIGFGLAWYVWVEVAVAVGAKCSEDRLSEFRSRRNLSDTCSLKWASWSFLGIKPHWIREMRNGELRVVIR